MMRNCFFIRTDVLNPVPYKPGTPHTGNNLYHKKHRFVIETFNIIKKNGKEVDKKSALMGKTIPKQVTTGTQ